jgi:formamidopyrimidine-DNA glycosylase
MPEYPDIVVYVERLRERIAGHPLRAVRLHNPFLLRTVTPTIESLIDRRVIDVERLAKRVVLAFDGESFAVLHLMVAGRLRWLPASPKPAKPPVRITLGVFSFDAGTLVFTEAGSKRRASLHLVQGRDALRALDPGGADVFAIDRETFAQLLTAENHTLKRVLTDPHVFSGIGNAYSDEILFAARLSPLALSQKLTADEILRLYQASKETLTGWADRLRTESAQRFPENVTAFRPDMAVHGRYGAPCRACALPVQRIVYADSETNYCARCQTGGKLLADRALSRLLHASWPKNIDESG